LLTAAAGFDVEVLALIAIVGASREVIVREQPHDGLVAVLASRDLARHLTGLPVRLGRSTVHSVNDVAPHLLTWRGHTASVRRHCRIDLQRGLTPSLRSRRFPRV
jgi:hypothetical protein